ncbi:MAG: HNH endonuclease [Beijerinckiaceae bacterium]|nr:HNH endonuclease [Beijerinckiaceae bacterium]
MITTERLREVLAYDPDTGVFTWRVARGRQSAGPEAGSLDGRGYRQIRIDGRRYQAHRLAWLYMAGAWPKDEIDHVNMDCADNRFENLREATRSQNQANIRAQSNNTSGFKGVCWHKRDRRWEAKIMVCGRKKHLGYFDTPKAAHAAYVAAAKLHFKEFARFE